jgi:hypothetical protein
MNAVEKKRKQLSSANKQNKYANLSRKPKKLIKKF